MCCPRGLVPTAERSRRDHHDVDPSDSAVSPKVDAEDGEWRDVDAERPPIAKRENSDIAREASKAEGGGHAVTGRPTRTTMSRRSDGAAKASRESRIGGAKAAKQEVPRAPADERSR